MQSPLEPRKVSLRDIPGWMRESWALFCRRPIAFLACSSIYHFFALSAASIDFGLLLAVLLSQICIMIGITFAEAIDKCESLPWKPSWNMLRNLMWCMLLLTLLYILIFLASAIVTQLLDISFPDSPEPNPEMLSFVAWLWPGLMAFLVFYVGVFVSSYWFLPPLLALLGLEFGVARRLAKRAEEKNQLVVFIAAGAPFYALLGLLFLRIELGLALSLLVLPLVSCYMYVSFRHVFWGRKENAPQRQLNSAPTPARPAAAEAQ